MKITTSILAILILFLSTQCVIKDPGHEKTVVKETCCLKKKSCKEAEEKKDRSSEKKDEGCKEACNPFMACCGCFYTVPEKPAFTHVDISNLSVKTGFKKIFFISNYNADCWHPPR